MSKIEKHLEQQNNGGKKNMDTWIKILLSIVGVGCAGVIAIGISMFNTAKDNDIKNATTTAPVIIQVQDNTTQQKEVETKVEEATTTAIEVTYNEKGEIMVKDDALAAVINSTDDKVDEPTVADTSVLTETVNFVVNDIEPCQLYAVKEVNIRKGPDADDFEKVGSLTLNQRVTVTGIINEYNGEAILWYRIEGSQGNIGYVSGAYLAESPVVVQTTPSGGNTGGFTVPGGNGGGFSGAGGGQATVGDGSGNYSDINLQ